MHQRTTLYAGKHGLVDCGAVFLTRENHAGSRSAQRLMGGRSDDIGMGQEEMKEIAEIILLILSHTKPALSAKTGQLSKALSVTEPSILDEAQKRVAELLNRYPLYPEIDI